MRRGMFGDGGASWEFAQCLGGRPKRCLSRATAVTPGVVGRLPSIYFVRFEKQATWRAGDMAGYSGTPLAKKIGIKANQRVALIDAPPSFPDALGPLPDGVSVSTALRGVSAFDLIVFFAPDLAALTGRFARLADRLTPAGGLWVAWPKKASGVATDLTENVVRAVGLEAGLVDVKVCAVDDVWSGLRFVYRLRDRPAHS